MKRESFCEFVQKKTDTGENSPANYKLIFEDTKELGHQRTLPSWIYDGAILAIQEGTEKIDEKIIKAEEKGAKICGIWSQDWCGCRRTGFGTKIMLQFSPYLRLLIL